MQLINEQFILEVNVDRVCELMSIGDSFEVPRQFVPAVDGSGNV